MLELVHESIIGKDLLFKICVNVVLDNRNCV
jgi:hypothetical protein